MDTQINTILERMRKQTGKESVSTQLKDMGEILAFVAEEEAKSAEKVRKQTNKIIFLTWGLLILTFILLVFTGYLCCDTYHNHKSAQPPNKHQTEK